MQERSTLWECDRRAEKDAGDVSMTHSYGPLLICLNGYRWDELTPAIQVIQCYMYDYFTLKRGYKSIVKRLRATTAEYHFKYTRA